MKRNIITVCAIDIIFLLLLVASSAIPGLGGELIYALAFILPTIVGIIAIHKEKKSLHREGVIDFCEDEEELPEAKAQATIRVKLDAEGIRLTLPLIIPCAAIICLISLAFSALGKLLGIEGPTNPSEPFFAALLTYALLPAVLEEVLFRYVPLKLSAASGTSMRYAVMLSAVMFAFGHLNLLQIPYALAAGLIFAWLDVITDSILPSVILHAANNAISLLLTYFGVNAATLIPLGVLLAASVAALILMRGRYIDKTRELLPKESTEISAAPLLYVLPALLLAILSAF